LTRKLKQWKKTRKEVKPIAGNFAAWRPYALDWRNRK